MNNLMKLGFVTATAVALAATPALAFNGNPNGWGNQQYNQNGWNTHRHNRYENHRNGDHRYSRYDEHRNGQYARNDMAPQGLKGPKFGRDGYATFQNGPYRNPYANNWQTNGR